MWSTLPLWLLASIAYLAMAPRVVNGDGLGYLKAALDGGLYPGHVAWVPVLSALAKLTGATRPVELLWPARVVCALSAATAAATLGAIARRRVAAAASAHAPPSTVALAASLGLAASWGTLSAGSDVESYAPALAALTGALWCAERQRAVGAGLMCALAALLHIENLLFVPVAALLVEPRARRLVLLAAALPLAAVYGALLPGHGVGWLLGASHGLHYPLRWTTPAVALYGACKALVWSPYPYEASWPRVIGCFTVGAAAAAGLAACARRPLPRAATMAWVLPYALVGCAFYASDAERWTFLLPLAWLAAAARPRGALAVAAAIVGANLLLWLPVARDDGPRRRAADALAHVAPGDLVIGPGHGWDEYIGFYEGTAVTAWPLVYWAGAVGAAALPSRLDAAVARARAGGHRVWLARLTGDDGDPMGWKELRLFGVTPANVRALLPPGRAVPVGDGLERFDPWSSSTSSSPTR